MLVTIVKRKNLSALSLGELHARAREMDADGHNSALEKDRPKQELIECMAPLHHRLLPDHEEMATDDSTEDAADEDGGESGALANGPCS